jgi:hypothetical protein
MNIKTEIQEVNIPANALTTCPDKRYALVSIEGCCTKCHFFRGLYDVMEQDAVFAVKYRVQCGVPQAREIIVVDMGVQV